MTSDDSEIKNDTSRRPVLFLGPPPPFARTEEGRVCPDVASLASALSDLAGHAIVVISAPPDARSLAALGERFPDTVWWCGHTQPCADTYARHAMPRATAHAIRSPLGVLEGAVEELEERLKDDGPEWGMLHRSIARLRRLAVSLSDVASLAVVSRETPGETQGAPTLRDIVQGAWNEAQRLWPLRREIDLELEAQGMAGQSPAASQALERALRELFVNARQHGASHVRVRAASDARSAQLEVLDDGPGPGPASDISNWSPFVSARDRGARSDLAVGLGIARSDVRRFGGRLEVGQGNDGLGTLARLSWPVQAA